MLTLQSPGNMSLEMQADSIGLSRMALLPHRLELSEARSALQPWLTEASAFKGDADQTIALPCGFKRPGRVLTLNCCSSASDWS